MIKRTLYFGNAAYLSVSNRQLHIRKPDKDVSESVTIPVEDIGVIVADHPQITFTQSVITSLQDNNAVILWCGSNHMPLSLSLPLQYNDTYTSKVRSQLEVTEPLKKQLWKQTIVQKITNQAAVLKYFGMPSLKLEKMAARVSSGDAENHEGQAAAIYWQYLMKKFDTSRGRFDGGPNIMLNYGYAILRAVIARSLVGGGCLTVVGIHHKNQYNPHCLADDIMEPFRPLVDKMVFEYLEQKNDTGESLTSDQKVHLLQIPAIDITIGGKFSPLMVGTQRTAASLVKCFQGTARKILYPELSC